MNTSEPQPGGDFWPGQFGRTHVGVTLPHYLNGVEGAPIGYRAVMAGLRAGRVWLDHGHLLDGLDVRLKRDRDRGQDRNREQEHGRGVTLGGRLRVRAGDRLTLEVAVTTASRANPHGVVPELAHVDVIRGAVRGAAADRDGWRAPDTRVVHTADVSGRRGTYTLRIPVVAGDESFHVRLRGSDGRRHGAGYWGPPWIRTGLWRMCRVTVILGLIRGSIRTRCSWRSSAVGDGPVPRGGRGGVGWVRFRVRVRCGWSRRSPRP